MGSAQVQGELWGRHARDWAEYVEQQCLPLHGAVLDAARVRRDTRLLDAGCGTGLVALLASLRGAQVSALDATPALLVIAREGDLEALPYPDASFDTVVAVNSVFYAADMDAAMRELARVVRPGGRVVVTAWGPPERCETLVASFEALGPLTPPRPDMVAEGRRALSEPGVLDAVLATAGLRVAEVGETACPWVMPDAEFSWRMNASIGPVQAVISHAGEEAVRAAIMEVDQKHMRPDGSIRYENVFLWAVGERP
jgi:SAM-dependent methyltransferase